MNHNACCYSESVDTHHFQIWLVVTIVNQHILLTYLSSFLVIHSYRVYRSIWHCGAIDGTCVAWCRCWMKLRHLISGGGGVNIVSRASLPLSSYLWPHVTRACLCCTTHAREHMQGESGVCIGRFWGHFWTKVALRSLVLPAVLWMYDSAYSSSLDVHMDWWRLSCYCRLPLLKTAVLFQLSEFQNLCGM